MTFQTVVNMNAEKLESVRACICQLKLNPNIINQPGVKHSQEVLEPVRKRLVRTLNEVKKFHPKIIVFPETSIAESFIPFLRTWSKENECIVVAGSHYFPTSGAYVSRAPVIFPTGEIYYSEKKHISPLEKRGASKKKVISGSERYIFENTQIGTFMVLICSDFLARETMNLVGEYDPDIILIPAMQPDTQKGYHAKLKTVCNDSPSGTYCLYANAKCHRYGDGKSALFGLTDKSYLDDYLRSGASDLKPTEKLWEAKSDNDFLIVDLNIAQKKPVLPKNTLSGPNAVIVETRELSLIDRRESKHQNAYKLVAFDMDGTLIRGLKFSWTVLWELCGDDGTLWKQYMQEYRTNKITYSEWCQKAVDFYSKSGLSKTLIEEIAIRDGNLVQNFYQGMKTLKENGYKLALISGGVDIFLRSHIPEFEDIFDDVYINHLLFDANDIVAGVNSTEHDYEGKAVALEEICERHGFDLEESIFVGDTFNDAHALDKSGHSIIFRESENDTSFAAEKTIFCDDLTSVVDHILSVTLND